MFVFWLSLVLNYRDKDYTDSDLSSWGVDSYF